MLHFVYSQGMARWIPVICIPLAIVGLIDDRKGLPAIWRYLFQLVTSITILSVSNLPLPTWSLLFCVIGLTAIMNFVNFMDGLDGLVAGCAILLMAATSSWALSGSIFGFLLWNWSPAKVFMGDVGSTFIGAVFGGLIFQQMSSQVALSTVLLGFPLFGDAIFCLIRRFFSGKNIFTAHRDHLFQRLNKGGWSHAKIAMLYIGATALLLMARGAGGLPAILICILIEFGFAIYLDLRIATKFGD